MDGRNRGRGRGRGRWFQNQLDVRSDKTVFELAEEQHASSSGGSGKSGNEKSNLSGYKDTRNFERRRENIEGHWRQRNRSNYNNLSSSGQSSRSQENLVPVIRNARAENKRKYPTGFKVLADLETKSPGEVLFAIKSDKSGFKELLNSSVLEKDKILKIFHLISIACQSDHKQSLSELLENILKDSGLFLDIHTLRYLLETQNRPSNAYQLQSMHYILDLIETFQTIHPQLSLYATQLLLPQVKASIDRLISHLGHGNELLERVEKLDKVKNNLADSYTVLSDRSKTKTDYVPNDFREIPIFPDKHDLVTNERPFLRPNIIDGRYNDVNHYLDVQFRLLREDFIRPLREGICAYLEQLKENKFKRLQDIKIYQEVQFRNVSLTDDGVIHGLQFDVNVLRNVRWESSKRLIYGALVCLTLNNFETVYFGTVAKREVEKLKDGFIGVKFEKQDEIMTVLSEKFIMVETEAYFEASRHVLTALQNVDESSFPLKEHIVELQKKVGEPQYLTLQTKYCLRCVMPQIDNDCAMSLEGDYFDDELGKMRASKADFPCSCILSSKQILVSVFDDETWPTPDDFKLDSSQYNALKSALRQKLCIIQGPPGTGKTFVGLKIMETLLHNQKVLKNPILIVCYTNHALDQFLEGVLKLTNKVVRMGGRSNSETLKPYTMNFLKRVYSRSRLGDDYMGRHYREMKFQLEQILNDIKKKERILKQAKNEVMSEVDLENIIRAEHRNSLVNHAPKFLKLSLKDEGKLIRYWLGLEIPTHIRNMQDENALFVDDFEEKPNFEAKFYEYNEEIDSDEEINLDVEEYEDIVEEPPKVRDIKFDDFDDEDLYDSEDIDFIQDQRQEEKDERKKDRVVLLNDEKSAEEEEEEGYVGWNVQGGKRGMQKHFSAQLSASKNITQVELFQWRNVWSLKMDERWRLYKNWLDDFNKQVGQEIKELKQDYEMRLVIIGEAKSEEEVFVAKKALVIGMTTTGAAKYRHLVSNIRSKIVIVEEAAEVLEAHIITSLSKYTEHLILIGDHQQLRPNPVVYDLAKKYKLEVSLFERLIKNGVPYVKLRLQHRMRPDISRLLVPHIYEELEDHPSVFDYEEVLGFTKSLYFINHKHLEMPEADSTTRVNTHEAQFLVALCRYILQQGYQPSQITILTTYLGQLFDIKRHLTGTLKEVRATVVDNFQGEENDIILLSFVRSNEQGNIGFLKTENRVCVALSRAKKGLFCIGNFDLFSQESQLWTNIITDLEKNSAIGPALELKCQLHKNVVPVLRALDFTFVPDGGCAEPCDYRLKCGHVCVKKCHPLDKDHKEIRCRKPCDKIICELKHKCNKLCFQDCGQCNVRVRKIIPNCKHELLLDCYVNENTYTCTLPCPRKIPECNHDCTKSCGEPCGKCCKLVEVKGPCGHSIRIECLYSKDIKKLSLECRDACSLILPCGHCCNKGCGSVCQTRCSVLVPVTLPCGHKTQAYCHQSKDIDVLQESCRERCEVLLKCEHTCSGTCGTCYQGRLHVPCTNKCPKILVCGHPCTSACSSSCPPCMMPCENRCTHSRCQEWCGYPCPPCLEICKWSCKHEKCSSICGESCNRPPCDKICTKKLKKCKHPCVGMCGEPCPILCRICNREELQTIFFGQEDHPQARFMVLEDCGHVIEIRGLTKWVKGQITSEGEIKVLCCPLCKTAIRKNLRFGNEVKSTIAKIEKVKEKVYGQMEQNDVLQKKLLVTIENSLTNLNLRFYASSYSSSVKYKDCFKSIRSQLQGENVLDQESLIMQQNFITMLETLRKIEDIFPNFSQKFSQRETILTVQEGEKFADKTILRIVQSIIKPGRKTSQLVEDMSVETRRLQSMGNFLNNFLKVREHGSSSAKELFDSIIHEYLQIKPFTNQNFEDLETMKQKLIQLSDGAVIGVTQEEKFEILKAMGLQQGHWFTCPNGHIYCITECGGAMEEGHCNECNATIGGASHRLREDNRIATAMDGSRHAAWSEQVNLANYEDI